METLNLSENESNLPINAGTDEQNERIPRRQAIKPNADTDKITVLANMLPKWDETILPVAWMKKTRLQTIYETYISLLQNRKTKGAKRGGVSGELSLLDSEMDVSIEFVKNRLAEHLRSKSAAFARYREFGIRKEDSYKLPSNREERIDALRMLIEALAQYNFVGFEFGADYWTTLRDRYVLLTQEARQTDGTVSGNVGDLKSIRAEVDRFNSAFVLIVRGNYPDTWQQVLREFGFQKEKY